MTFFSSWNQRGEPNCPTDLDTNSDWCAIKHYRRAFYTYLVFYTLEFTMQGKMMDSGATRPNSTFNRRKVMRGRLARVCCRIGTGISNLSPNYVCGATLTHTPVLLRAFPQSVTHRQWGATQYRCVLVANNLRGDGLR